jgi:hypothetical protein
METLFQHFKQMVNNTCKQKDQTSVTIKNSSKPTTAATNDLNVKH